MKEVYLDNAATTCCSETVRELMCRVLTEDYGNASSMHRKGVEAEQYLRQSAARIAKTLRCREKEIVYTSGGTESNNLALIGAATANRRAGMHIITTSVEHPSVKNTVLFLEEQGFEITFLDVDENGIIDLDQLKNAVRPDTILASIMMVNNEMGAVQPVEAAAKIIHAANPKTIFHVDAIQAYGKMRIYPGRLGIDLLSVSGHKIHGPKGIGFLYIKEKTKIKPVSYGGGQQKGMRSGTINTPGIAGLGLAAQEAYEDLEEKMARLHELKTYFAEEVVKIDRPGYVPKKQKTENGADGPEKTDPDISAAQVCSERTENSAEYENNPGTLIQVNGLYGAESAPHIISVSFPGIRSEVLLHALEDRGIYVSAGSACSSHHPSQRNTLDSMGLPKRIQDSTLRFSFSVHTTKEELDFTLQALGELVPLLRKYRRH